MYSFGTFITDQIYPFLVGLFIGTPEYSVFSIFFYDCNLHYIATLMVDLSIFTGYNGILGHLLRLISDNAK